MIEIGNDLTGAIVIASIGLAVAAPHLRRKADPAPPPAKPEPNPELEQIVADLGRIRDELAAQVSAGEHPTATLNGHTPVSGDL